VDFLGEQVSVVGLLHRPELNGVHGRIFGVEEDTGRFIVRLQGVAGNVSVRPQNLVRLVRVGRYLHFKRRRHARTHARTHKRTNAHSRIHTPYLPLSRFLTGSLAPSLSHTAIYN
jgi:hypothetical protein